MTTSLVLCILACVGFAAADEAARVPQDVPEVGQALIAGGTSKLPSAVPWNIAIYKADGHRYEHQCSGTLISPNLVVTAAHCFWDLVAKTKVANAKEYKVVAGKIYRDWALDETNPFVQRLDIEDVILDNRFEGWVRQQLAYDFALVKLTTNVTLNEYVQAVRVAPGTPNTGSVGVVAGWGYDDSGNFSHELRSVELPYVDYDSCFESLEGDKFRRLLTFDKFCAGFIGRNIGVCPGDGGGGFVEVNTESNIATLRGIVSIDFRPANTQRDACYAQNYAAFTNVGDPRFINLINCHRTEAPAICPPLTPSPGQLLVCHLNDEEVECLLRAAVGTTATVTCKPSHKLTRTAGRKTRTTCGGSGIWSKRLASCQPSRGG